MVGGLFDLSDDNDFAYFHYCSLMMYRLRPIAPKIPVDSL
jgi:hypothetical protein